MMMGKSLACLFVLRMQHVAKINEAGLDSLITNLLGKRISNIKGESKNPLIWNFYPLYCISKTEIPSG